MSIIERFNKNLKKNPVKKAIISMNRSFTFRDIDNLSNYVAWRVMSESKKEIVPFYIENTMYVLPVVLGIIKAGRIPLPITNSLPIDKSLKRITDIEYDVVICDKEKKYEVTDQLIFVLPASVEEIKYGNLKMVSENRNSYVICTSGTTGIPKKVFLTVDNIIWLLEEFYKIVDFTEESRFLFTTPYTFDVSLTEIFAPVFTGGTLICYDGGINSIFSMEKILDDKSITHLSLSPSFAETIIDTSNPTVFDKLKVLCLAGEIFPGSLANKLRSVISKGCRVFNLYGPSETTVYATYYELKDQEYMVVPIGKPLPGVKIEVKQNENDSSNQQGELWIGGKGVTDGYVLEPNLCAEKFVKIHDERFYKTGDYVYFQGEDLVFGSRIDNQVQVNGIRVELDEIKSIVDELSLIESSRVVFYKKKIYIFYMSSNDLKNDILNNLPTYLKPVIVKVDNYLLNQNRKLDVVGMLERYYYKNKNDEDKIRNTVLKKLSHLGSMEVVDLDSLELVRFYLEIEEAFNIEIKEDDIYKLKDVESLVEYIKDFMEGCVINRNKQNEITAKDMLNLEYALSNPYLIYSADVIKATPTQARLFQRKQFRIIDFDIRLNSASCEELLKLNTIIKKLSEKIDIFRLVVNKNNCEIKFGLVEKIDYNPSIIILENFPTNTTLQEVINKKECIQIPIIIVSTKHNAARFYFSYHSIDTASMNKLEKILLEVYADINRISLVKESSLLQFEQYKSKMINSKLSSNILKIIPVMNEPININLLKDGVQIFQIPVVVDYTKEDIYLYSVYAICKCILLDYNIINISGGLSYDFRSYKDYDGENLIGDVHKKIPFEIKANDYFKDFRMNFSKMLDLYSSGLDFYEIAFRRTDSEGRIVEKAIRNLCLSINYIGEVMKVEDTINKILANKFEKNFINIFTHKGNSYAVICSCLLKKDEYSIYIDEQKIIKSKIIRGERYVNVQRNT